MRRLRGLSQQQLSDRLRERTGNRLDRTALAKLENPAGTRAATARVCDVVDLAVALDTSPLYLLTPENPYADVRVAGRIKAPAAAVRGWWRGFHPLPGADPEAFFATRPPVELAGDVIEYQRAAERVQLARELGLTEEQRIALGIGEHSLGAWYAVGTPTNMED
jgi:hypothetical protein